MGLKPKQIASFKNKPTIFRDFKQVEWTVGNITLDASKLTDGQVVEAGTCVFRNDSTGLYELVKSDTPETMAGAVVTGEAVKSFKDENEMVSAIRKASLIEARCTGVTANFKKAVQGRITFDI